MNRRKLVRDTHGYWKVSPVSVHVKEMEVKK